MLQAILCVGIEPSRLRFLDDLARGNYIMIVCGRKASEMNMTDDYFKSPFTYIEADPERFESVSQDVLHLLSLAHPPRDRVDLLITDSGPLSATARMGWKALLSAGGQQLLLL